VATTATVSQAKNKPTAIKAPAIPFFLKASTFDHGQALPLLATPSIIVAVEVEHAAILAQWFGACLPTWPSVPV
jgi:hypothetical protein